MSTGSTEVNSLLQAADAEIGAIFDRCADNAPNFGVHRECFVESLHRTIEKYLASAGDEPLSKRDIVDFISQIQADDLFMAIACSRGSERAWWEFDQQHRS
jgi:hypothetical protein